MKSGWWEGPQFISPWPVISVEERERNETSRGQNAQIYTEMCFFALSRNDLVCDQQGTSSWNGSIRWWVRCSTVPPRSVGEGEKVGDLKDKTHKDTLRHETTKWNRDTRSPCLYLYFKCWHTKRQSMLWTKDRQSTRKIIRPFLCPKKISTCCLLNKFPTQMREGVKNFFTDLARRGPAPTHLEIWKSQSTSILRRWPMRSPVNPQSLPGSENRISSHCPLILSW